MLNSADTWGVADSFEQCERLRRITRETIDRARRIRSEATEMRLQAEQTRADRQQWLSARRREDIASRPVSPLTLPHARTAPAVQLTALAAFVHARLDEEAASADLYHKAGCPAANPPGARGPAPCACGIPHRLHQKIADRRSIARFAETAIRTADHTAPNWPRNEIDALQDLQLLAMAYELHWLWQEEWRP
ncbi:hypothetical protein [Streptomyces sp. NPDC055189]